MLRTDREGKPIIIVMNHAQIPDAAVTATRPDGPAVDNGPLDNFIAFHLRVAQNASFKSFKRIAGDPALRPGWYTVLTLIGRNPGITPMALSRASGRDKSTISPVVRGLEQRGLVTRRAVAGDRRSSALSLTPEGQVSLARLAAAAAAHDRRLDEIVAPRKAELIALLKKIVAEIDQDPQ